MDKRDKVANKPKSESKQKSAIYHSNFIAFNYRSSSTMESLNEECLITIFSWLSVKAKFGVLRVNREWQRVIEDILKYETELALSKSSNLQFRCDTFPPSISYTEWKSKSEYVLSKMQTTFLI